MEKRLGRHARIALVGALFVGAAACGDDKGSSDSNATTTTGASATTSAAGTTAAPATGAAITLAVNPWTGSAVNANVAKVVLESRLGTSVTLIDIDENAAWPGLDTDQIDANLEVWPSGHAADADTYIGGKKSVVALGLLGPVAKIGWYVPTFVVDEHPELATWEGFKNADLAKLFATAETGSSGQFLMGDPSYVSFDEQIIKNLNLPLKFVVAGSEAAEITAIQQAVADHKPLLLQFWKPHWLHATVKLTEVALPPVTDACLASAAAKDGKYACDYAVDNLYKVASVKLQTKNPVAFAFLSKFQLTTEQQNEIGAMISSAGMAPDVAAKTWVDAHPDIVAAWLA